MIHHPVVLCSKVVVLLVLVVVLIVLHGVLPAEQFRVAWEWARHAVPLQRCMMVADTNLRPSGIGRFDGEFIDVLSNRGFISKGTKVVVVKVRGKVVTVKEVEG